MVPEFCQVHERLHEKHSGQADVLDRRCKFHEVVANSKEIVAPIRNLLLLGAQNEVISVLSTTRQITFLFKMVQFAAKSCGRSLDQLPIANDADCSVKILPRVALADGIR